MKIEEAIQQLQGFITAYENEEIRKCITARHGFMPESITNDYMATKTLITAYLELKGEMEGLQK